MTQSENIMVFFGYENNLLMTFIWVKPASYNIHILFIETSQNKSLI